LCGGINFNLRWVIVKQRKGGAQVKSRLEAVKISSFRRRAGISARCFGPRIPNGGFRETEKTLEAKERPEEGNDSRLSRSPENPAANGANHTV
jgi:hypothetical protein